MADSDTNTSSVELAAELTMAWLSNPNTKVEASDVANVLRQMHDAVNGLSNVPEPETPAAAEFTPAVTVRKSLASKDHIISLIDGKPYRTLRRHLSRHGLSPEDYRARYGLKPDYPMVSESYSQVRRDMANKIGLGRKPKAAGSAANPADATQDVPVAKPEVATKPAIATKSKGARPKAATGRALAAKTAATSSPVANKSSAAPKSGATKSGASNEPATAAKPLPPVESLEAAKPVRKARRKKSA